MDLKNKKKELTEEYNKLIVLKDNITARLHGIEGTVKFIDEMEAENKDTKKQGDKK